MIGTGITKLAALAVAILLVACSSSESPPEADGFRLTEESAISAIERYHADWEALDFAAVAEWHTADFEYVFFTDIVEAEAFPAILSEAWMTGVSEYSIDESDFRVVLIAPDHAFVTVTVEDQTTYENGSRAQTSGVMSYLLSRQDEWKIQRIHHSGPAPDDIYEGQ